MKKVLCATTLMLYSAFALSTPVVINDAYIGSNDHGYGDVIGDSEFDIHSMTVDRIGDLLSVTINTNFQAGNGLGSYPGYTTPSNGIGFGDLFLSSGWTPYGPAPYMNDNHNTGTIWEYGVSLDNRWDGSSSGASLYALNATFGNPDALLSDDFVHDAIFRNGQEVAVDTTSATFVRDLATDVTTAGGEINFMVDISGTSLAEASSIALHWAMTCGNDVIEGAYVSAPEPSTITMMLLGLIGIGASQMRRRKSAASYSVK